MPFICRHPDGDFEGGDDNDDDDSGEDDQDGEGEGDEDVSYWRCLRRILCCSLISVIPFARTALRAATGR